MRGRSLESPGELLDVSRSKGGTASPVGILIMWNS